MLNEFTTYTSNLDATKNDATHKVRDRGYCPNGTDIGRPVAGSLPLPPPSSSWNYPYLSNLYNYYNPNSYELGNVPQYDNQKCSSQYVRNYNEHSSRFHSTSVLQCCDPRCQLIAKHAKYPYHPVNTKINQHANKRTKNYYGSIVDLPKPDASVTGLAPSIEHTKYTPCVPYPTLRNDLNGKYSNQPSEYCSPFTNTLKRGADSTSFNEYYTDIGNPSYWNKPNTSIWNRNSSSSYYPPTFEDKNTQKIDQGSFSNGGSRGILFNRLLEHRDHPYDTGYAPNYYYGPKNDLNPNINYNQPNLPCEPVISDNRLPLQANSYQPPPAYNIHYPPSQTIPQYYKESTPKRVPDAANQETRILDKNPNLDVREFLSTWEDDVDDEKVVEPTTESPVIVLDCSNLEGDVLAKVKEKLNGNAISNDDTAILKIVDVSNSGSTTILSPHTSVIQENAVQSKEVTDKSSLESSHMNSDGYMTWYSNGKKKEDFSYDLVEMTERLVNTVGKLLSDPEKKPKPTSPVQEPSPAQLQDSHSRLLQHPLPAPPVLPNNWNPNTNIRKNINIPSVPPVTSSNCLSNVPTANNASYNNYSSELDRSQQPQTEKNVSCTFNLRKTSNDLKFSVNYSTQQNDYNVNKATDMPIKFKSNEFNQPYYEYHKTSTANPSINASNYKSYSTYSSYYENTGCNYDPAKLCDTGSYNPGLKDNSFSYVDHIEKHAVSDTDITLVKADLEKSLNEISHPTKSNNSNTEKNCQYFDTNCLTTTELPPKLDESFRCNERIKSTESQIYNGVIQKTGICNSPLQKVDGISCGDNLLSMPSLSPPPNSSSMTTQPVISAPSVSQKNGQPLCGINLTLTDVYENEDTIFDTSQGAESNTFIPFCSGNQTPNDQTYQPLNLAVSRDIKPQDSNIKSQQKTLECDGTNKIVESKANSKADDGYYSVENAEADEVSGNSLKTSTHGPVAVAYHPCIVSHEQPKLLEIHGTNQTASELISQTVSSHQRQQDNIITSDQLKTGDSCNSNIISSADAIKPRTDLNKESINEILPEALVPDKSDKFNQIQSGDSCMPVLVPEDNLDRNDAKSHYDSDLKEKMDGECDTSSLNDSSNLDKIVNTPSQSETESNNLEKVTESDEVDSMKEVESEPLQSQKYEQEDTALNLKVQPDPLNHPIPCGSVIKENENFVHTIKENNISLSSLDTDQCGINLNCAKEVPKLSCNSDILIDEKQSSQSVFVDQDVNSVENNTICTPRSEDKIQNDQLKRKSIDTSISNINLPMKKRRGQEYLTQKLKSLESTVAPAVLIISVEDSKKNSSHSPAINMHNHEENESIANIPRKNKKKRKKDKSKNSPKLKKYSKFKRHSSYKEQINYLQKSHSFDENEPLDSIVPEINKKNNAIPSASASPVYDNNDDMFNIPSVAPTPKFDLIQDFELQKEQSEEEPSASFNLNPNPCKSNFISASVDLHMTKAPSPNCILQDDSFINEKQSNEAPSPYYDYNYEGMSPSSVAPSPNYDIIEGVLIDDTDSSRNNEDVECKNKNHLELETVDKHVDFQERLGDFNRSTKYSITENEYESDYEIDRYYCKRKRDSQVKRLVKKSKDFLKYNYENKSNNHNNSRFSVNIFRHFDYAVDDERCIRSEDDEYEPRPNHIRHAFRPKSHTNCLKAKDNGKHIKKYLKYNQRGKKRMVDSKCDLYFNKKKSTYINSPEYQLPVNVSSQCDKIISKFQMIEATRSDTVVPDEDTLDCQSPRVISRDGSNGELSSDMEGGNLASSPVHIENISSVRSTFQSDTEISDYQDTNKLDSNHLQNSRDIECPINSPINNVMENQISSKSTVDNEENHSPIDTVQINHFDNCQPSNDISPQLAFNSEDEKISSENNINTTSENSSSEKLLSISDNQEFGDQRSPSFNEENAHSLNINKSNIKYTSLCNPTHVGEDVYKEANDETNISPTNQLIPHQVESMQCTYQSVDHLKESRSNSLNDNGDDTLPIISSENGSCNKLNNVDHNIKNDEYILPSTANNITRIESPNLNEDDLPKEILHSISNDSSECNEKTPEILLISQQSLPKTDHSSNNSMDSVINSDTNSDLDTIGKQKINISSKSEENDFGNQKNSPIHEKEDLSYYSSNPPGPTASPGDETEKLLDVEKVNEIDNSSSLCNDKYTTENKDPLSTEKTKFNNIIHNDQNHNACSSNESVCSLNNTECNNTTDTILDTSCESQKVHSPDPVIHNICSSSIEQVSSVSSEDHAMLQKNLSGDSSPNELLSSGNEKQVEECTSNETVCSSESINKTDEPDTLTEISDNQVSADIPLIEKHIEYDSPASVDDFDEVSSNSSKTEENIMFDSHSPMAYSDDKIEEAADIDKLNVEDGQILSPSKVKDGDDNTSKLSDLENYSQEPVLDPFNDNLQISDCNDNICKMVDDYESSLTDSVNSDSCIDHQTEHPRSYSDEILFANSNSNSPCNIEQDESSLTNCDEVADIQMETGLCDTSSGCSNEVPTLRFLAVKALSRATINNNLLEVRETPERTEIIIHSDERCDPADLEDGDSCNLIMTDTFDDDTHVSPNFEALKEMTFDYPTLPESASSGYEEKNDEDLPCQCLIISSEESILCLRCSLNSSVDTSQFQEMDENCQLSVNSLPGNTPTGFDYVEGDCIEQSFIDQEIDFAPTSPAATFASANSSPCPPIVENVEETAEKTQIKVQLPWHKIFNLGDEINDSDNVESSGVCRQRMLELGPAQIEVRMVSDDCSWWRNSSSSGNSSPVVKVKRLVLQRAAAEAAAAAIEAEESNSMAQSEQQESAAPAAKVNPRKGAPKKLRKKVKVGERTLNEILGVPKMVIRKTSCRQYKSYLRTPRILQPVVRLKKNKRLDELALKYHQGSEPFSINTDDIEPKPAEQDAVTVELDEEIVAGAIEKVEISQKVSQEVTEEVTKEFSQEISQEVNQEVSQEVGQEVSQEVREEFSEEASTGIGTEEQIVARVSEEVEVSNDASQECGKETSAEVETEEITAGVNMEVEVDQEFDAEATVEVRTEDDEQATSTCENKSTHVDVPVHYPDPVIEVEVHNTQTEIEDGLDVSAKTLTSSDDSAAVSKNLAAENTVEEFPQYCSSTNHFREVRTHLALRAERHHCMLCHLSYNSVDAYKLHLRSRFHRHLELMQRETVHALYRRFTGRPCPSLRPLSAKERKIMKWKPRNADVNHFYHHKAPLQIALQSDDSSVLLSLASDSKSDEDS